MSAEIFKISDKYQYIILDLDNTLYDERLYLYPAYKKIATSFSKIYTLNTTEVEKYMISEFEKTGRKNLFNKLCLQFHIPESEIDNMFAMLRTIQLPSKIEMFDKMKMLVDTLVKENKNLFVVTNGNPQQQQNKVGSINWEGRDRYIHFVFATAIKPKPDKAAFDYLVGKFGLIPEKTLFIGDSDIDSDFAKNCGIDFLNAG